jgi:hypothetical protein
MRFIKNILIVVLAFTNLSVFAARDGNGNYNLPAGNPVQSGTTISSSWANGTLSDVASALTGSISRDGQSPATGNLAMGGYVLKNLGNGTLRNHSVNVGQIQDSSLNLLTSISGTDTITATLANLTSLVNGQIFNFKAVGSNTGAVTININGIGAKAILSNGSALIAGNLQNGRFYQIIYDGTQFNLQSSQDNTKLSKAGDTGTGAYTFDYTGISTVPAIKFTHSDVWLNTAPYGTGSVIIDATGQNNNQPLQINRKTINDATFGNGANLILQNTGGTGVTTSSAFQADLELVANNSTLNATIPQNGKYEIHVTSGRDTGDSNKREGSLAIAPRRSDLHPSGKNTGFDENYWFLPASTVGGGLFLTTGNGIEINPKYDYGAAARFNLITPYSDSNIRLESTNLNSDANLYLYSNTGSSSGKWHLMSNGTSGRFQIRDQANGDISALDISAVDDGLISIYKRSDNTVGRIRMGNTSPSKIFSADGTNTYNFAGANGVYLTTQGGKYALVSSLSKANITTTTGGSVAPSPLGTFETVYLHQTVGGSVTSYTITLPTTPVNGQIEMFFPDSNITGLTVNSLDGGATIAGGLTSTTAFNAFGFQYYAPDNIWLRIK